MARHYRNWRENIRMMRLWRIVVSALVVVGCTKHNPRACLNGTCSDPAFPFCDVQGDLGGVENECVSVTCTPHEFAECRGLTEVRCDEAGSNYAVTQCERVCDPTHDGCRLCDASESACTNSTFATCDANGTLVGATHCALGCFDTTRCKEIAASNGLSVYRDMVPHPPDLDLSAGGNIDTKTGKIDVLPDGIPNFLVDAPANGAQVRVFVAARVRLGDVTFHTDQASPVPPAIAIIATDEITVEGTLSLGGPDYPPGTVQLSECSPPDPTVLMNPSTMQYLYVSQGGGGFATMGGKGGDLFDSPSTYEGGAAGGVSGTTTLIPLRGGCAAGLTWGGGSIQLTSNAAVRITGTIDVRGKAGTGAFGGGAGGGVLLEAPVVEIGPNGRLLATGGGGGSKGHSGQQSADASPALGGTCNSTSDCGVGGSGAAPGVAATAGGNATTNTTDNPIMTGAGGGGLGRLRINTTDTSYMKTDTSIEAGALTTGMITVR